MKAYLAMSEATGAIPEGDEPPITDVKLFRITNFDRDELLTMGESNIPSRLDVPSINLTRRFLLLYGFNL